MIEKMITVDEANLSAIERQMESRMKKAPIVLKRAVNQTAKEAVKKLSKKARDVYVLRGGGASFRKEMTVSGALAGSPEAVIRSKGEMKEMLDFKVSPTRVSITGTRPEEYEGKIYRDKGMAALNGETKAFIAKFKSGHKAVVERVPGRMMDSNPKKEFLRKLLSPSVPQMIGNEEKVYGPLEEEIHMDLKKNIRKHMELVMGG